MSKNTENTRKNKRIIKVVLTSMFAALAVLLILYFALKLLSDKVTETSPIEQADETYQSFNFYPVPEKSSWDSIDIYSDPEYAALDSNPSFTSHLVNGTSLLKDIPDVYKNEAMHFFEEYFEMLKLGDYKKYPELFSEKYKKNMTGFEDNINREFPPQMVYDIKITEQARVPSTVIDGKECVIGLYEVSYHIFKNNGLFRNDIGRDIDLGRDIARPLFFELVTFDVGTQNEKTYINNLYTASSISAQK